MSRRPREWRSVVIFRFLVLRVINDLEVVSPLLDVLLGLPEPSLLGARDRDLVGIFLQFDLLVVLAVLAVLVFVSLMLVLLVFMFLMMFVLVMISMLVARRVMRELWSEKSDLCSDVSARKGSAVSNQGSPDLRRCPQVKFMANVE
jgi:hypothetical protein